MPKGYKFQRLYKALLEILKTNNWETGDRFHSETQLCNKFDVSRQTVRKALAQLVDEGFLIKKHGSGTFITEKAIAKRNVKTNVIGILVTYLSDYIFPVIINQLEQQFTRAGFAVQLASSGNSTKLEGELLQKMLQNNVDGIILEPTRSAFPSPNINLYKELTKQKYPMVTIHSNFDEVDIPTVALNDKKAGFLACEHLFKKHHQNIGAIIKADDLQGHNRYKGILEAHSQRNLIFDDKNVYWYTTEDISNFHLLEDAVLNRLENCSAVICYNDQIAIEYEKMLLNKNFKIPEDKSIISIDNSKYAELAPVPLTSVESPIKEIGIQAAKLLLQQIQGEAYPDEIILEPQLVVRKSCSNFKK